MFDVDCDRVVLLYFLLYMLLLLLLLRRLFIVRRRVSLNSRRRCLCLVGLPSFSFISAVQYGTYEVQLYPRALLSNVCMSFSPSHIHFVVFLTPSQTFRILAIHDRVQIIVDYRNSSHLSAPTSYQGMSSITLFIEF